MPTAQQNTRGLMAAVSSLPELTERKRTIDKHTNLATALLGAIQARRTCLAQPLPTNTPRHIAAMFAERLLLRVPVARALLGHRSMSGARIKLYELSVDKRLATPSHGG